MRILKQMQKPCLYSPKIDPQNMFRKFKTPFWAKKAVKIDLFFFYIYFFSFFKIKLNKAFFVGVLLKNFFHQLQGPLNQRLFAANVKINMLNKNPIRTVT